MVQKATCIFKINIMLKYCLQLHIRFIYKNNLSADPSKGSLRHFSTLEDHAKFEKHLEFQYFAWPYNKVNLLLS